MSVPGCLSILVNEYACPTSVETSGVRRRAEEEEQQEEKEREREKDENSETRSRRGDKCEADSPEERRLVERGNKDVPTRVFCRRLSIQC